MYKKQEVAPQWQPGNAEARSQAEANDTWCPGPFLPNGQSGFTPKLN